MLIISLTKFIAVVLFMKIFMDIFDYEQGCANNNLSGFVRDHKRTIAFPIKESAGKKGKVGKVSIRGFVKIDDVRLHEASFEKSYVNAFYEFILILFGAVRKEFSFTREICGTTLVITATIFVFK